MSRSVVAALAAGCLLVLAAAPAPAQTPPGALYNRPNYGIGYRPQLNPYLNLANGGDPAIQYYLRTLPEINQRATNTVYGAAIGGLEGRALAPAGVAPQDADLFTPPPTTGHPVVFGNTLTYFPGGGGRPAAPAYPAAAPRR